MWRNGPLHFTQNGKCETREELNSFLNNLCGWGVPACMRPHSAVLPPHAI